MVQLSLRIDEQLHRDATLAARAAGTSLNGYLALVLRAALTPHDGEPESDRIRARLAAAGLIDGSSAPQVAPSDAPSDKRFMQALERSRGGTPASTLIAEERGGA